MIPSLLFGNLPFGIYDCLYVCLRRRTILWWICLTLIIILALSTATAFASGLGGYISEKLIDRSGVSGSSLLIGRSGVDSSSLDMGMGGIVATGSATNIYMDGVGSHATLSGNLQSLNGFPQATVYFDWGYDGSYGHTSSSQVMVATGSFSIDIHHYDPSRTVYYRAVVETDGTNRSSPLSFVASGAIVTGYNLLNSTVVLAYTAMVIFAVLAIGRSSVVGAVILMAVAIYMGEAFIVAIQEAIRNLF